MLHKGQGELVIRGAAENGDGSEWSQFSHPVIGLRSMTVGEIEIQQNDVEGIFARLPQLGAGIAQRAGVDQLRSFLERSVFKVLLEEEEVGVVVLDAEDADG